MLTVVIIAAFLAGIVVTVLMTGALSGSNNDAIETVSGNEMQQSAVSSENSEEFEALMSDPVESSVQSYVSDIPEASEYSENSIESVSSEESVTSQGSVSSLYGEIVEKGTLPYNNNAEYIYYKDGTVEISGKGEVSVKELNFSDKISKVVINEGLTSIRSFGFSECTSLTKVKLPSG